MEVLPGNAVIPAQVPFRLVPEVLNAVDVVIPVGKEFRMIDPHMVEVSDIELVIGTAPDNTMGNSVSSRAVLPT